MPELTGSSLGDHLAVVDDGDPAGELVGLLQVLRAEQVVVPPAASARMISQTWLRERGRDPSSARPGT